MHDSVMEYVGRVLPPWRVKGRDVLECGSLDVNGTVRPLIQPHANSYTGTDIRKGPGVDVVCDASTVSVLGNFDIVVSTEMLEHAEHWREALSGMVDALRENGMLVLTTRGPGAGRHDHPGDYWRFTRELLIEATRRLGVYSTAERDPGQGYTDGVLLQGFRARSVAWADLSDLTAEPVP